MPRKKLVDENAEARRRVNMTRSAVAYNNEDDTATKKLLSGNTHYSGQGRCFARDIKNISGRPPAGVATTNNAQSRLEETSVFRQITVDFRAMNLRSADVASRTNVVTEPDKTLVANTYDDVQPATLFSREAFSGSHRLAYGSTLKSSKPGSLSTKKFSRYGRSSIDTMKRSSFRSASIVSQSTPLLGKTGRRSIRLFRPLEDDSDLYTRYSLGPISQELHTMDTDAGAELHRSESEKRCSQTTNGCIDDDFISQLASQLNEVTLSPCTNLVPDNLVEASQEESVDLFQEPAYPQVRLKGRATSVSLGFIPIAFPEEINIKDLRIPL
ncbi:hypothetical protein A7U60_g4632 [Sanghuangporus baumii]|uniref:Uncharacterized protein n=1 Tax=Sanghuangporus baumii TaxID=108892 RepID=A0A9Q5HY91_SANBA|nr:hypothetical protein A7U60_g4632 [Sanghuangporus baumii]